MKSLGIDASTNCTGLVVLTGNGTKIPTLLCEAQIKYPKLSGMDRHKAIVLDVLTFVHSHQPDVIVIEGYSLNMKNASSVVPLVELGGLIRFMLHLDGLSWLDPRAGEVKKFVLGKGVGPKDQIMMFVLKRWGHTSKDNNTADAYALACMGLAHSNQLPGITEEMRKVVGNLKLLCN